MSAQSWDELRETTTVYRPHRSIPVAEHDRIRALYYVGRRSVVEIARSYGVTRQTIYSILSGRTSGDETHTHVQRHAYPAREVALPCPVTRFELHTYARTMGTATSATIARRAELERVEDDRYAREMTPEFQDAYERARAAYWAQPLPDTVPLNAAAD